ncbi:MAG TPA: hypothetical protein VHW01_24110, partial [Polyangiaceae bacterium]|nr:hypothetical protein [Polyangiaceae bacterium]
MLAGDLRQLATAHSTLACAHAASLGDESTNMEDGLAHADGVLQRSVEQMLDNEWPGESALDLVQALRSQQVANAQQGLRGTDANAERVLMRIEECVSRVVMNRANATIDRELANALDAIRDEALPTAITAEAEKALDTAKAVIDQLREPTLLHPVGPQGTPRREQREAQKAEQTAQMLQLRLATVGASDAELTVFMQHLSAQSLS